MDYYEKHNNLLSFSIGVSASSGYDRQEADACITISERLSVKTSYGKSNENVAKGEENQFIFQEIQKAILFR